MVFVKDQFKTQMTLQLLVQSNLWFVDVATAMMKGLLIEAGKVLGLNSEDAALFIINDIRGLKVNKVIKNVDDLLDVAGKFRKGKTKIGENTIQGNINEVFNTITEGSEVLELFSFILYIDTK